jgi:hypothetical protein
MAPVLVWTLRLTGPAAAAQLGRLVMQGADEQGRGLPLQRRGLCAYQQKTMNIIDC